MESAWKVTVWGVRGSMPMASAEFLGYGGDTACISVDRMEGGIIVFDAGSGLMQLGDSLAGSPARRGRRVHILLSHLHIDHTIGLFGFKLLHDADAQIHIYGHGSGGSLKKHLETMFGPPYWPLGLADMPADIQIHEVEPGESFYLAGEEPREGEGWGERKAGAALKAGAADKAAAADRTESAEPARIHVLRGGHPGGSLLYRLERGKKSIVHALDCELDKEMEEALTLFARHSSLLIWDGTFTGEELTRRKGWGHSCWEQGICVRRAAEAEKVLMTHYSSGYTDRFLEEQERLARAEDEACLFAREGLELWI